MGIFSKQAGGKVCNHLYGALFLIRRLIEIRLLYHRSLKRSSHLTCIRCTLGINRTRCIVGINHYNIFTKAYLLSKQVLLTLTWYDSVFLLAVCWVYTRFGIIIISVVLIFEIFMSWLLCIKLNANWKRSVIWFNFCDREDLFSNIICSSNVYFITSIFVFLLILLCIFHFKYFHFRSLLYFVVINRTSLSKLC